MEIIAIFLIVFFQRTYSRAKNVKLHILVPVVTRDQARIGAYVALVTASQPLTLPPARLAPGFLDPFSSTARQPCYPCAHANAPIARATAEILATRGIIHGEAPWS